jgi:integrase
VAPQAASTLLAYQGKWRVFVDWCGTHGIDPLQASSPQIADFLLHMFQEGRAPVTIAVYRTSIAGALKLSQGVDYGADQQLSALLRSFQRERPRSAVSVPGWDLSFVLWSLTQPPFEPLSSDAVSLKLLTLKTVFLTLLASGSRRGEIHALSGSQISHDKGWTYISIRPVPGFLAKTELRSSGASVFEGIRILSLAPFVGSDLPDDRKLCPVRALKIYLARTQSIRKDKKRLFISYQEGRSQDISKNTISAWVKKLLKLVYKNNNDKARELTGCKTHDIRGMAATWASRGTYGLEALLRACTWKGHSTFSTFYLKDLTEIQDDLLRLGPLSVAQSVVLPSQLR